ncbi:MAG: hypothetical protein FIA97_06235 [Methylococcaceae bacterium]|nr:hypothetical protein [Methylococcaceae bacterium]
MFRGLIVASLLLWARFLVAADWADPMRPPAGFEGGEAGGQAGRELPKLSAIRIGPSGRVAVIGGAAVSVGETVAGYQVLAIEPGKVTLLRNGAELELPLWPQIRKTRTKGH